MIIKTNTSIFLASVRYCSESMITSLYSSFSSRHCQLLIVAFQKYIFPISICDLRLGLRNDLSMTIKLHFVITNKRGKRRRDAWLRVSLSLLSLRGDTQRGVRCRALSSDLSMAKKLHFVIPNNPGEKGTVSRDFTVLNGLIPLRGDTQRGETQ